jgi:probable F420-dependent oxidoreductase
MTHPFRFGALATTPPTSRKDWSDTARRVEDLGFSTLQVTDHFVRTPLAPMLALAAAAQVTTDIRLGTLVLDNDFRHPAVLAKEISTLDLLCDGRLEVGLGAGWLEEDYAVSGIEMDAAGTRISRLTEAVRLIRGSLSGDQESVSGEFYRTEGLRANPQPVQRPCPPLLLGGGGPRVLRMSARYGDIVGVNLLNSEGYTGPKSAQSAYEEAIDDKIAIVRATSAEFGRDPQLHILCYWAEVTDDPEATLQRKIDELSIPVTAAELARSPHCLVGPLGALTERVAELRERWGFSYFTVYERDSASCAELVSALAGK